MINPLNNYITVKLADKETKTKGGILLSNEAQESVEEGKVIHAGTCKFVKKGDTVFFKDYSVEKSADHTFVKEDEILGKI